MAGGLQGKIYRLILCFITLSGFAQMPIFKRYYIADIPGLGWLARFYVTHSLHYIMATALLALVAYVLADLWLNKRGWAEISLSGKVRGGLILGLVVTGAMMVVKNLPGVHFSHMAVYAMNLIHLGCCMALLAVSGVALAGKKGWVR